MADKYDLQDPWYPKEAFARARVNRFLHWHHLIVFYLDREDGKLMTPEKLAARLQQASSKIVEVMLRYTRASSRHIQEWADSYIAHFGAALDVT